MSKQSDVLDETACGRPEPIEAQAVPELAAAFKALGDPVRLRLLSMIASRAGGETCVCELTEAFALRGPTISHHLKVLRTAGLIDCQRRGTWVYYWAVPETLSRLSGVLAATGSGTESRLRDRLLAGGWLFGG